MNEAPSAPRLGLAAAMLGAALMTCALGVWQVRRNAEKAAWIEQMHARLAAPAVELATALADPVGNSFRRVTVEGRLHASDSILLDHQSRGANEGFHLVTPLEVAGRDKLLLVDRGFLPWGEAERFAASDRVTSESITRIEGVLEPLAVESLSSDQPDAPRQLHWNRLHLGALERQIGHSLEPALLLRAPQADDKLPLGELPEPRSRVDHVQYAITWFAIAAIAVTIAARELWKARVTR